MTTGPRAITSFGWIAWLSLALLASCDEANGEVDCSSGVCVAVGPDASSIGALTDGGTISIGGGKSGAGGSGSGGSSARVDGGNGGIDADAGVDAGVAASCTESGACIENWSCTPWQTKKAPTTLPSGDNAGTRSCKDLCKCGTEQDKPVENATLPALDFEFYQCEMEPIFDGFCAQLACHGSETGRRLRVYARSKLRIGGEVWTSNVCGDANTKVKSETCTGSNECRCWQLPHSPSEWQRNYDAARGFALDAQGELLPDMERSELVRNGLALENGGLQHAGVNRLFSGTGPVYAKMVDWLAGKGKGCVTPSQKSN
jgi:hypothetical protein